MLFGVVKRKNAKAHQSLQDCEVRTFNTKAIRCNTCYIGGQLSIILPGPSATNANQLCTKEKLKCPQELARLRDAQLEYLGNVMQHLLRRKPTIHHITRTAGN
jgi:hypothetical protein